MAANEETVWLLRMPPKLLGVLEALLRGMEQLPMATRKEEQVRVPDS